jgi:DNA adenine methylase
MKPFVKWIGGKQQHLDLISKHWPDHIETYYEPFLGGGSVFLHFLPQRAVLSDCNRTLMNSYICIQKDLPQLMHRLQKYQQRNTEPEYMEARKLFNYIRMNKFDSDIQETALFIYLNKHGYRGLYRENSKGGYNVPYGNYKKVNITDQEHYMQLQDLFRDQDIKFKTRCYKQVLKDAKKGDFVFLDPPYHETFSNYSKDGFCEKDHLELAQLLIYLDEKEVKFMCFNSNTKLVRKLYKQFEIIKVTARRSINKKQGHVAKPKYNELLIKNY